MKKIQSVAYEMIQSDALFIYSLTTLKKLESNYILMSFPYIGIFADGAEQWCRKMGLGAPSFNYEEKQFYAYLRKSHKLFEKNCSDYVDLLQNKFEESDNYFHNICSFIGVLPGYYNVGTDLCNGEFCGNTITCSMYVPVKIYDNSEIGPWLKKMGIVAGKLARFFHCIDLQILKYEMNIEINFKDYHFYKKSPLKLNNELGFLLFTILCTINYVIEFIEVFFIEEIPQKFKFAYIQYYYLCDFIEEINENYNTSLYINNYMLDREFRNCLTHYGLGQYMRENEIITNDVLKGLTNKAFNMNYETAKKELYKILKDLTNQIKEIIF